jgi:hypothetical protein
MRKRMMAGLALLAAGGCSAGQDVAAAAEEVERFHDEYNDRDFDDIYEDASREFTRSVSREDLTGLLERAHSSLGDVRDADRTGWNVSYNNGTGTVKLTYDTRFERGEAREEFEYILGDGGPRLLGYRIDENGRRGDGSGNEQSDRDAR